MIRKMLSMVCLALSIAANLGAQTYVFAGDSITDGGWGRSGGMPTPTSQRNQTDMNHIFGHSFMMLCASDLQSAMPSAGLVFQNRGISGDTLEGLSARWDEEILSLRPDAISILIGINDATKGVCLREWENSYRTLLKRTLEALPGCRIILCTPFTAKAGRFGERADYDACESSVQAMADIVRRLAEEFKTDLVPFDVMFQNLISGTSVPAEYWIWDGIHPTPAGHRRMADLWEMTVGISED